MRLNETSVDPQKEAQLQSVRGLVDRVRRRIRTHWLLLGLMLTLLVGGSWLFLASLFDAVDPFGDVVRYVLFAPLAVLVVFGLSWSILRPLLSAISNRRIARQIESTLPGMHQRLVSVVDLALPDRGSTVSAASASPAFFRRLLKETVERTAGVRLNMVVSAEPLRRLLCGIAVIAVLFLVAALVWSPTFPTALVRILNPWSELPPDVGVRFELSPGDVDVLRGDSVQLSARVIEGNVQQLSVEMKVADGAWRTFPMTVAADGLWSHACNNVNEPAIYRVRGGGTWSKIHRIAVLDRPRLDNAVASIRYPAYLGIDEPMALPTGATAIAAPAGSVIALQAGSTGDAVAGELEILKPVLKETATSRRRQRLWFADRLPGDAQLTGLWQWSDTQSSRAHSHGNGAGLHEAALETQRNGFPIGTGDWIFVDSLVPAADAPELVAIDFRTSEEWKPGVVWTSKSHDSEKRIRVGGLAEADHWSRLEFPAKLLGLEGQTLQGIRFASRNGAWQIRQIGAIDPPTQMTESMATVDRIALQSSGPDRWSGQFPLNESLQYRLTVRDRFGHPSLPMDAVRASVIADRPPVVRLDRPEGDIAISKPQAIPVAVVAEDDFGLASIQIVWRIEKSSSEAAAEKSAARPRQLERMWFSDRIPDGAKCSAGWKWEVTGNNDAAHFHIPNLNLATHDFQESIAPFRVFAGDKLFAEVFLPHTNRPDEILLAWHDGGDWEHRAYWGKDLIGLGRSRTPSRQRVGEIPGTGEWVRVEVPAKAVGLEGKSLRGMAFTSWGGTFMTRKVGAISRQAEPSEPQMAVSAEAEFHPTQRLAVQSFPKPVRRQDLTAALKLEAIGARPGDVIAFAVEANDRKGQVGRSRVYRVRIADDATAVDRQLAKLQEHQDATQQRIDKLLELQKQIGEKLKEIAERLLSSKANATQKDLQELAKLQEENRELVKQLREALDRSAQLANDTKVVPREFSRRMQSMSKSKLADTGERMKELSQNLSEMANQKETPDVKPAQAVEKNVQDNLKSMQAELQALTKALKGMQQKPGESLAKMQQTMRQQAGESAGKDLADLRDFAKTLSDALLQESKNATEDKFAEQAAGEMLLSKARQLLDMPDAAETPTGPPADEKFQPAVAEPPKPSPGNTPSANESPDRADAKSKALPKTPGKSNEIAEKLKQAGGSLAADSDAVGGLAKQLADAMASKDATAKSNALGKLISQPQMQQALAMAGRMRTMQMEAMAQSGTKSDAPSKAGKVGKSTRTSQAGSAPSKDGGSHGATPLDALGELDVATQNALMKLQPKLREQILEGIREQGPQAWRPIIRDYFDRLSRSDKEAK